MSNPTPATPAKQRKKTTVAGPRPRSTSRKARRTGTNPPGEDGPGAAVPSGATDAVPETRKLLDIYIALDSSQKSEFRSALSPCETMVFNQIVTPNHEAWIYLITDQGWNEAADCVRSGTVHLKFEHAHLARGLEMDLGMFVRIATHIRRKFIASLETGEVPGCLERSIMRRLEAVFGLPSIPLWLPATPVRRLLTITARDQMEKVTAEVAGMLKAVGAKWSAWHRTSAGATCWAT